MAEGSSPAVGHGERRVPLWPVLSFAFLNSLGTGAVALGIFFIAEAQYHFTLAQNFGLGALFGVVYGPAALGVGPAVRALIRRKPEVTTRRVLGVIMLLCAGVCLMPALFQDEWAIWVLMPVYGILNGVLWPLTEGYVSGGRRGDALRAAVGKFNITWSGALVVAMWAATPLLAWKPLWVLGAQGVVHLAAILFLVAFTPDPATHSRRVPGEHPPIYERLLGVFRLQLPTSFVVISALEPFLPFALNRLEIDVEWKLPMVSVWMASRVGVFALMTRWGGWHGRWWTSLVGGGLMLVGFAAAVFASTLGAGAVPVGALLGGLVTTGVGVGVIYAAALYYALEVGLEEVDAGGTHEALIGLGYFVGPACGLIAALVTGLEWAPRAALEPIMLAGVWFVCITVGLYALAKAFRGNVRIGSGGA